jgi:hypothetical protein
METRVGAKGVILAAQATLWGVYTRVEGPHHAERGQGEAGRSYGCLALLAHAQGLEPWVAGVGARNGLWASLWYPDWGCAVTPSALYAST